MIEDADRWAPAYAEAGCGSVTFHVEAAKAPVRLAREIRGQGARASMALKPATPIEPYEDLLAELDMVLIMTVEPGFGWPEVPRPLPAQDPPRPRADGQARRRDLAPGRRRGLAGDDRALRRGRRRRLRRRLRGLLRRRPGRMVAELRATAEAAAGLRQLARFQGLGAAVPALLGPGRP